jgi:nucleotide-binding universal stress UspA family protein
LTATARPVDVSTATDTGPFQRILLASEGRTIPNAAIARVVDLAQRGATVRVFSIARIHGTAFGMPTPGLLPSRAEWAEQRDLVDKAIKRLKSKGLTAEGHVLGTRNATKKILQEASQYRCQAIVMAADPDRARLVATAMWSQEPQRVRRKARVPVFLVATD